jgi:hypothetical protein
MKLCPEPSKQLLDPRGTFLVSSGQNIDNSRNILMSLHPSIELPYGSGTLQILVRLLSCKWSSIESGHPWWSLCIPTKELCRYCKCWCPIPFACAILAISETWSWVSPYLVQSHYRHCYLLIPMIFHPRDLVTGCNIGWISPSGPRVSFNTRMSESRSWCTCLNLLLWHTQETSF